MPKNAVTLKAYCITIAPGRYVIVTVYSGRGESEKVYVALTKKIKGRSGGCLACKRGFICKRYGH